MLTVTSSHSWHGHLFAFVIPTAVIIFACRALVKIPDELFQKILHFILLGAYIPLCFGFETWWMAV